MDKTRTLIVVTKEFDGDKPVFQKEERSESRDQDAPSFVVRGFVYKEGDKKKRRGCKSLVKRKNNA